MQAIILAGGQGTRLRPYTVIFPKPMLPVGGKPIIEIIVNQLASYGFTDIVISLGYLGDYIRMFFNNPANVPAGVTIRYIDETTPLGTAGPIGLVEGLEDNFLVINGDILTTLDYSDFMRTHVERGALLSVAVGEKTITVNLGILDLNQDSMITNFHEKPTYKYSDNMGIYIYSSRILRYIEKNTRLDLNNLVLKLIGDNEKVFGYCCNEPYYWIDIGATGDYEKANLEFENNRAKFEKR
ncbi:MAG: NTP transferase domain-containing protein [Spirochaetales bacterium]|nr:NTP transferase domain-containing protein [Spirochaetales bacterium]